MGLRSIMGLRNNDLCRIVGDPGRLHVVVGSIDGLLADAEELEARSAGERVEYYRTLGVGGPGTAILDVGCGNGYAVARWRALGARAVGIDSSLYRLSRWVEEAPAGGPLVVADAGALPFRPRFFSIVISSGMIEHVGVSESTHPYSVTAQPEKAALRLRTLCEMLRVVRSGGSAYVDCPNGAFPVDFWHGDRVGSFRLHAVPDALLPSFGDFRRWAGLGSFTAELLPLTGRLRFRQVSRRWWGRLLSPAVVLYVRLVDRLVGRGFDPILAPLYPYLVILLRPADVGASKA